MRKLFGTIAGVAVAILTITALEFIGTFIFPGLADFAVTEEAEMAAMIAAMPLGAKLLIVSGWGLGAFAGALVAFRAARWEAAGWIVAIFVVAGGHPQHRHHTAPVLDAVVRGRDAVYRRSVCLRPLPPLAALARARPRVPGRAAASPARRPDASISPFATAASFCGAEVVTRRSHARSPRFATSRAIPP